MKPRLLEVALLSLVLLGIAAHVLLAPDPERRGYVFAPEMMESRAYETHDPNWFQAGGATLQRPPAGTIARGLPPLVAGGLVLDLEEDDWTKLPPGQRAAWDAYLPPWAGTGEGDEAAAAADATRRRRGAEIYVTFCVTCHGPTGNGDGPSVKRGVPPPTPFPSDDMRGLTDGHLFRSITRGKGNMPSYASQVSREDRWKAILYVRSLQQAP